MQVKTLVLCYNFFFAGARWGPSHKRKYLLWPQILFSGRCTAVSNWASKETS